MELDQTAETLDAEYQEAIDLVSFGRTGTIHCGNCGCPRTVGNDTMHPYEAETCPRCGDEGFDLLELETGP